MKAFTSATLLILAVFLVAGARAKPQAKDFLKMKCDKETCEPQAATEWCKYVKTVGPSYDCGSLRDGSEKGDFSKFRNCLWNCYSVKEGKKEKEKGSTNYCEAVKTWKVDNPNSCNIEKDGDKLVSRPKKSGGGDKKDSGGGKSGGGGSGGGGLRLLSGADLDSSSKSLRLVCATVTEFLRKYKDISGEREVQVRELDAQMANTQREKDSKLKKHEDLEIKWRAAITGREKAMSDSTEDIKYSRAKVANKQKEIREQRAEFDKDAETARIKDREAKQKISAYELNIKIEKRNIAKFDGAYFKDLQKEVDLCEKDKAKAQYWHDKFDNMRKYTTTVTQTLATQIGSVATRTQPTKVYLGRQWNDKTDRYEDMYDEKGGQETVVETKIGMVVTKMEAEVNLLAEWLMNEEGATIFTDEMKAQADAKQARVVKAGNSELDYMADKAKDAFKGGKNLRFRSGHLAKHAVAMHSAMKAISSHLSANAAALGKAHHTLKSTMLCYLGLGGSCVKGIDTVEDFSKMTANVVKLYSEYYKNLCALEKDYTTKRDKYAAATKKMREEMEKEDKTFSVTIQKFDLRIKNFDKQIDNAQKLVKELQGEFNAQSDILIQEKRTIQKLRAKHQAQAAQNKWDMEQVVILLGNLRVKVTKFQAEEERLASTSKACQKEASGLQKKIADMKAEALGLVKVTMDTKSELKAYVEKANEEDNVYQNAADQLNKMRDNLMDADSDLKMPTLSDANFSPHGSGQTSGRSESKKTRKNLR